MVPFKRKSELRKSAGMGGRLEVAQVWVREGLGVTANGDGALGGCVMVMELGGGHGEYARNHCPADLESWLLSCELCLGRAVI